MKKLALLAITVMFIATAASADSILFNYSQRSSNNIATPAEVGVDALVNVEGGSGTQTGTLDGVGYSMTHGDYWQQYFLTNLGQPYAAVIEGNSTVTLTGLSAWLTAQGATAYEVNVFYAGDGRLAGNDVDSYIAANSVTVGGIAEIVTLSHLGVNNSAYWAADGATHTLALDTLTITDTATSFKCGISSVQITSVPEPATMSLLALGGMAMLRRRKK